ncbi:Alpha/Beta hydrolase protein [Clohesyomyces aquaticus]|uniref:Alpha/Beta hydrolase protein n=1 Tax=Clohesyomyces aquaticus TaxID=1231657 RepID=A0A1Y2A6S8_9PLEO|nr:Alpha/Beta hydrolase protein [Clohesyomyces aquaticus]
MLRTLFLALIVTGAYSHLATGGLAQRYDHSKLDVKISVAEGLLNGPTDGRIVLMFAPNGTDVLNDTDVTSSQNKIFGKNVFSLGDKDTVTFSGGSNFSTETGVYGWPDVSLDAIPPATYRVQAFLTKYEKVTRSDGSTVSVHFPCGDGAPNVDATGSLFTSAVDVDVVGGTQTINLTFNNVTAGEEFIGKEIGGCNQGNYEDTENLKHVKIRSKKLSEFWGRDMYVGANVVLPAGYSANDTKTRYPVIYAQGHWPADEGAFGYGRPAAQYVKFADAWNNGTIPGTNTTAARPAPKMILVTFRHEAPFYDDSYAVNTANLGPYGDAINDELIPFLEDTFNTIRAPYARIQQGGSTGGWESIASVIFRPDLFGACFSSYPDSLDFHRHQDIELYTAANAYVRADGSFVPSIRTFDDNGTEVVLATVALENHWELTFGTASRSFNQWDIWNAVFGVQGYNNYPLEPWDKVTGEIYPAAVEYWKPMDLSNYIVSNWNNSKNLGVNLAGRIYVYVGTWDDYFLNEGVVEFQKRTDAVGGQGWANVTILPEKPHGGNYQSREIWDYLELLENWIKDHAPDGKTPLKQSVSGPKTRGNMWEEVIRRGGRQAAVARQGPPSIETKGHVKVGTEVRASVGRWDPGVALKAQWVIDGKPSCEAFKVKESDKVKYTPEKKGQLQLWVTGSKRNYATETRKSNSVTVGK